MENEFDFGLALEREIAARATQRRVENILGLVHGDYTGVGKYDMPMLRPLHNAPQVSEWVPFNYVLSDKEPEGKGGHFFFDDYQFERVWRNPDRYVDKLSKYALVATPDFSTYSDMPLVCQMFNHYRKQWIGKYWQDNGVRVIPTVRASLDERSLEWYLDGIPEGGAVIISSMWTRKPEALAYFKREYGLMYERLKPEKVFVYGKAYTDLQGNIEQIPTFAERRFKHGKRK